MPEGGKSDSTMIDNNIIQSLGAGSGIDTPNLVKQLVEIERAAPQARIDSKTELAETRISDFGLLNSALSTLKDAAAVLTDPEALFSKSASFTESDALVPLELSTEVEPGSYSFNVSQIAKAHTMAFSGFSSPADAVGEGTLTFNFGTWLRDGNGDIDTGTPGAFTQNTDKESQTITIDATNNSLEGLRDAINAADMGVSANIIFDGTNYNLSIVAESGASNELEISVAESGGSPTNTDNNDLSRFAFLQDKAGFEAADAQGGQNAMLSLNGIAIERSTNTIDDIVDGLKIDVLKTMDAADLVTITVTEDKAFAEQNIRDFVDAYNGFLEVIDPLFGESEQEDEDGEVQVVTGSLANDALAKSLLTQIRNVIASSIPGLADSNFTAMTNIGIRTELDGTISINEEDFQRAFDDNFEDVQKLLAPSTATSNNDIFINSYNDKTLAGEYEVVVTQAPSAGLYEGAAFSGLTFPLDTTGKDYTFVFDVNGTNTAELTLATGTYDSEAELATAIQSLINSDSLVASAGVSVAVSYNAVSGGLDFTSSSYGASSNVSVLTSSADAIADLGLAVGAGTPGTTVAGTINGKAAFGSANVLLPALGEAGEGLALVVGGAGGSATVNFSRGFAGELERLLDSFMTSSGVIATRTETLEGNIESYEAEQERLERRISAYEERLLNQFIAMERILSSLSTSETFLDNLIESLPFTSSKD